MTIRAAIVGGTGYGGMELVRYLLGHPEVEITAITSRTETGALGDVHPHLRGLTDLKFTAERAVDLAKTNDVLFFATPNGVAKKEVPEVLGASDRIRVIDLSNDWRWSREAPQPSAGGVAAVYGLPECGGRDALRRPGVRLVANPGCHATGAILALHPWAHAGWQGLATVVSVTGSSGSGAKPVQGTHHPERFSNFRVYKPLGHQHHAEIDMAVDPHGDGERKFALVPCSGPFARGIATVAVLDLSAALPKDEEARIRVVHDAITKAYAREPFVRIVPETPEVRAVAGTNFADVGVAMSDGVVCATVAIDNLGKGMAGTAVQNMNLLFGIDETTGLMRPGAGL